MTSHGGSPSDLIASIEERFNNYPDATKKILVYAKYQDISSKYHQTMPRACEVVIDYDLSIARHLSKTDVMMKSKYNKRKHASVLVAFNLGEITTLKTGDNGTFCHDEAGMTIVLEEQSLVSL